MLSSLAQMGPVERLQAIANKVDVATVKRTIEQHYGFVPSDDYCRDFVEFVMAMVLEPDGGNRVARK
jgi:hypothetical protein